MNIKEFYKKLNLNSEEVSVFELVYDKIIIIIILISLVFEILNNMSKKIVNTCLYLINKSYFFFL